MSNVRGLQCKSFCLHNLKYLIESLLISIYSKHNKKPILVIDFLGFVSLITSNIEEMLCGGRFNKYKEILEALFQRLSEVAELVFFEGNNLLISYKLKIRVLF